MGKLDWLALSECERDAYDACPFLSYMREAAFRRPEDNGKFFELLSTP